MLAEDVLCGSQLVDSDGGMMLGGLEEEEELTSAADWQHAKSAMPHEAVGSEHAAPWGKGHSTAGFSRSSHEVCDATPYGVSYGSDSTVTVNHTFSRTFDFEDKVAEEMFDGSDYDYDYNDDPTSEVPSKAGNSLVAASLVLSEEPKDSYSCDGGRLGLHSTSTQQPPISVHALSSLERFELATAKINVEDEVSEADVRLQKYGVWVLRDYSGDISKAKLRVRRTFIEIVSVEPDATGPRRRTHSAPGRLKF